MEANNLRNFFNYSCKYEHFLGVDNKDRSLVKKSKMHQSKWLLAAKTIYKRIRKKYLCLKLEVHIFLKFRNMYSKVSDIRFFVLTKVIVM